MTKELFQTILQTLCLVCGAAYPLLSAVGIVLKKRRDSRSFLAQYAFALAIAGIAAGVLGICLRWDSLRYALIYAACTAAALAVLELGIRNKGIY